MGFNIGNIVKTKAGAKYNIVGRIKSINKDLVCVAVDKPHGRTSYFDVHLDEIELINVPVLFSSNKGFIKHDNNKLDLSLVDSVLLEGAARALAHGTSKYPRDNWKNLDKSNKERILASTLRHLMSYKDKEVIDEESGLSHLDHLAANVMFLLYIESKK